MVEPAIKEAFSKVKEDIKAIEAKFEVINAKLDKLLQEKKAQDQKTLKFNGFKAQNAQKEQISSGNEGAQSINHSPITHQSLTNHSLITHSLTNQSTDTKLIKVEDKFKSLTNQEFNVFLSLYNLEDQLGRGIMYEDLASKLNLSTSCIRSYTSSMLKKGLPILKVKLNNRATLLKINPHFRELNLKERLTRLYFSQDPDQTTLLNAHL